MNKFDQIHEEEEPMSNTLLQLLEIGGPYNTFKMAHCKSVLPDSNNIVF
jgi:hypothetical protein